MKAIILGTSATSLRVSDFDRYANDIRRYKQLDEREEKALFSLAKQGDNKAKNKIINANLRFVVSVAKHYQGIGIPLMDLVNEGNIGLLNAFNEYDVTKGVKFISFAVYYIRQQILLSIDNDSRIVRLPHNCKMTSLTTSFDAPIGSDDDGNERTLLDTFACDSRANEYDEKQTISYQVQKLLNGLPTKHQVVIIKLFGLGCKQEFEDTIAKELKLTTERVRQIKHEAIQRMRDMM